MHADRHSEKSDGGKLYVTGTWNRKATGEQRQGEPERVDDEAHGLSSRAGADWQWGPPENAE
jgi:hypothetical protein